MLWITLTIIFVFFAVKFYLRSRHKYAKTKRCLIGKTAIITGANSGIGYETALEFAKRGARVILACRNLTRGIEAQSKIIEETGNEDVVVKLLELQSFESVRTFARDINTNEQRLDILINNAGIGTGRRLTVDGMNVIMQTNHLSPFLLTHLLSDLLKKSAPSRVVNVTSLAATFGKLNTNNLNAYPKYSSFPIATFLMYSNTKLCNILFTRILSEKLQNHKVTVNALHPGVISSNIWNALKEPLRFLILGFIRLFYLNSAEGAQTTIEVALSNELDGVTGKLFDNCQEIPIYTTASSYKLAEVVWLKSEELVKLCDDEKLQL